MPAAVKLRDDYLAEEFLGAGPAVKGRQSEPAASFACGGSHGMDRGEATKDRGTDHQALSDWVRRFNATGPDGLFDNWTGGPRPRRNNWMIYELAKIVERGPDRKVDGVVRWRRVDLKRVNRRAVRRRLSRALCRHASQEARLFPHERAPAPPRSRRADRRGFQRKLPARAERPSRWPAGGDADRDLVPG